MYKTMQRTPSRLHLRTHFPFRGLRLAAVTATASAGIGWAFTQQNDRTLQLIAVTLGFFLIVHQWFTTRRRELILNKQANAVFMNRQLEAHLSEVTAVVLQGCGVYDRDDGNDTPKHFDCVLRLQSGDSLHIDRGSEKAMSALSWTIAGFLDTHVRFNLWPQD